MNRKEYRDYLNDILESINNAQEFIDDLNFEEFITDKKTVNAVVRSLEILGEAAKNIPPSIKSNFRIFHGRKWLVCAIS